MIYVQIFVLVVVIAFVVFVIHDKIDNINSWNKKRLEKKRLNEIEQLDKRKNFIDV